MEIFGETVTEEKDFLQVRAKIGLLFQDSDDQLFSPTVLEDVAFGPLNLGKSRDEAVAIAEDLVKRYPSHAYASKQLKKFKEAIKKATDESHPILQSEK